MAMNTPMHRIDRRMQSAVAAGIFPGGVLLVAVGGRIRYQRAFGYADLFCGETMSTHTYFDLASLTKPLGTTLAVMRLVQENRLALEAPLAALLPAAKKSSLGGVTIRQLLCHTAGLAPHRPYYRRLVTIDPKKRKGALAQWLLAESLNSAPGEEMVYSDLGFMLLRHVVETITGQRMDRFLEATIYAPLGIDELFFLDYAQPLPPLAFAATELCPWRGVLLKGRVHDDNAWALGGIDGHAGLFGNARGIYRLLQGLFQENPANGKGGAVVLDPRVVQTFIQKDPVSWRALGFDMPSERGSSAGRHFSSNTIGHLGFTGTSFWYDLTRHIAIILLTNRVHPSRHNPKIAAFRPLIHDTIMRSLEW